MPDDPIQSTHHLIDEMEKQLTRTRQTLLNRRVARADRRGAARRQAERRRGGAARAK